MCHGIFALAQSLKDLDHGNVNRHCSRNKKILWAHLHKCFLGLDTIELELSIDNGDRRALYPVGACIRDSSLNLSVQFVGFQKIDGLKSIKVDEYVDG